MAFVKDVLVEEYIRLSEKLEFYLNKNQDTYLKTIVKIKKDMDFIEKAFVANNIDLAQEVALMQKNECEENRKRKQGRENTESLEMKNEPQKEYREEMKKASQDLRFMQDCKDVMEHFSQADEEVFAKSVVQEKDADHNDAGGVGVLFGSLGGNISNPKPPDIYMLREQAVDVRLQELGYGTSEPMFIYQRPDWPVFTWNNEALSRQTAGIHYKHNNLVSRMQSMERSVHSEMMAEVIATEVLKSFEIEGEKLNKRQIRCVTAQRMGLKSENIKVAPNVRGAVFMACDAILNCQEPLTKERLFAWHAGLFPLGAGGMKQIHTGVWRSGEYGPMRVVSGPAGHERVHFEALVAERLEEEMKTFLGWVNGEDSTDPIIRAGIAHLWFVTIHPFDDGNGRVARAIASMMLARLESSSSTYYSLAAQIYRERENYYSELEHTQKGTLDITEYLGWFLECVNRAIVSAEPILAEVSLRAHIRTIIPELNDRQRLVLDKLLDDFKGKLTVSKWSKLAKCSQDIAAREINDMLARGILVKNPDDSRVVSYLLAEISRNDQQGP